MKPDISGKQSQLFTLRLWAEQLEDGQQEWRGRIHCVGTDEVRHFRDWPSLLPVILAMLREAERKGNGAELMQALGLDGASGDADAPAPEPAGD